MKYLKKRKNIIYILLCHKQNIISTLIMQQKKEWREGENGHEIIVLATCHNWKYKGLGSFLEALVLYIVTNTII